MLGREIFVSESDVEAVEVGWLYEKGEKDEGSRERRENKKEEESRK